MAEFSKRLSALRRERGWTQQQLAEKMEMCRSNVANWESGLRTPTLPATIRLCRLFNVPADYLLGKSDRRDLIEPNVLPKVDLSKLNRLGIKELLNYYDYLLTIELYTK